VVRIPVISERFSSSTATEKADDTARDRAVARAKVDDRSLARDRFGTGTGTGTAVTERPVVTDTPTVAAGPRPRASLISTLALILGVVSALTVMTGILVGAGIAIGIVGILFGVAGFGATKRRHVAGKSDTMIGLALSAAAVVFGVLAFNGALPWLSPETDQVARVRDWLAAQLPWLFPS
jgi:hypothetical protein